MGGAGMGRCEGRRLSRTPLLLARFGAWLSARWGGLRAELSQPAMDRRILHRLSVMTEDELRRIGLTASDVRTAQALEAGLATDFLASRRGARSRFKER